jgi:diguanylate cyclase (GGDEF)-like protein
MVGVWLAYLRSSRPAGPVTNWLSLGMTAMLLGAYVDMLDEFLMLPKAVLWDNWLESVLTPLGMLLLTRGLHLWRQEQLALRRQLGARERVFRDHRRIDALTQLADAGYMAGQIELERSAGRAGTVLMLGWQGFEAVARRHGLAEADRMLQAAGQLLALHLRPDDLLCRYAGDRFVLLLPGDGGAPAEALARELQQALAAWGHNLEGGGRLRLPVAMAHAATTLPLAPADLLLKLAAELHHGQGT